MVRPSAPCLARLRLTTKQVNGGYYKGNRTGSMGAHTEWGGYVIDYRKTRNFVCPDMKNTRLSPFVTKQIKRPTDVPVVPTAGSIIAAWKERNSDQYKMKRQEWKDFLQQRGVVDASEQVPLDEEVEFLSSLEASETQTGSNTESRLPQESGHTTEKRP